MERHHLQRRFLHLGIGAAHEVAEDDDAIVEVAGVEGGVEDAAIGEAAVEDDGAHVHVAQQEIEVGRVEHRETLLGGDDEIGGVDAGDEFGPAGAFDGVLVGVRNVADIEREGQPPGRLDALDVVGATLPEHGLDVDDRHADRPRRVVKAVDRFDDFAGARRRTRTIGGVGEVALMHVDRDDRRAAGIGELGEARRQLAFFSVDIGLHGGSLLDVVTVAEQSDT